jgi:hypothetical protein
MGTHVPNQAHDYKDSGIGNTVSELDKDKSAEVRNKFQASLYLASVNMSKHGKVINEL